MTSDPAVDTNGQILLTLEGQSYMLRPSHSAIQAIERVTGHSLQELAVQGAQGQLSCEQLGIIVCEMFKAYGRDHPEDPQATSYRGAKPEKLSALIYEEGIPKVTARVAVVLMGALTGGYTASGERKATS